MEKITTGIRLTIEARAMLDYIVTVKKKQTGSSNASMEIERLIREQYKKLKEGTKSERPGN